MLYLVYVLNHISTIHIKNDFIDSINVIVDKTNLHNDASCDISEDGCYLAAFFPSTIGFPDNTTLGLFSLMPSSRGQCLYTKSFGKCLLLCIVELYYYQVSHFTLLSHLYCFRAQCYNCEYFSSE